MSIRLHCHVELSLSLWKDYEREKKAIIIEDGEDDTGDVHEND
jgi:hypothetical protein